MENQQNPTIVTVGGPEVIQRSSQSDARPRFMYRVMNIPVLRKAPWLMYLFMFCVAVGIAIMCVRLQLGDDLLAIVCACVTVGLILSTAVCVFLSIRRENNESRTTGTEQPVKKKRITITLKAQTFEEKTDLACPICLLDLEIGERVTELECGHMFHIECASNWVKRVAQCPACRFQIPTELVTAPNSGSNSPRYDANV
jgi:hypothetical protein